MTATLTLLPESKRRPIRFLDNERVVGLLPHAAERLKQRGVSLEDVAAALRDHDPEQYHRKQVRAQSRGGGVCVVATHAHGGWTVITVFKAPR